MPSLALLVAAQPKKNLKGPVVRLEAGNWVLRGNLVDSKVAPDFPVTGPTEIQLEILEAGSEQKLSLFAELDNGPFTSHFEGRSS